MQCILRCVEVHAYLDIGQRFCYDESKENTVVFICTMRKDGR